MVPNQLQATTHRRGFLGAITKGAAAIGLSGFVFPFNKLQASQPINRQTGKGDISDADKWFDQIKGKHRIAYDVTQPHEIFPFAWPKVFLLTNQATGSPASDCGVVVILRHAGIAYGFENRLWEKYKFGEVFKANDPKTKAPSLRNPFWNPAPGDFKVPGVGNVAIGINELQADGVRFCICEMAITVYSATIAESMKLNPEEVKKDWMSGLLPGIQLVPSGVWAVGRAHEHGCAYCFAG